MLQFVAFVALCTAAGNAALTAEGVSDIRLLHVVFRHGERAPADTYPNDPYINYTFPPYGWGQLTSVGRERQFTIGEFLRDRYDAFLGKVYHPDIVAVETTGVDRSIMSAQLQMAGMWPPIDVQRWNKYLAWQPISMKIDPLDKDTVNSTEMFCENNIADAKLWEISHKNRATRENFWSRYSRSSVAASLSMNIDLLLVRVPCAQYSMELEAVLKSTETQEILLPYKEMMKYLEENSGKAIRTSEDVGDLYSTLNAEVEYGLALPQWLEGTFPEKMEFLTAHSFDLNVETSLQKRIKGGPLLKKILQDSEAAASQTLKPAGRKLYMYGGHDSTIVNLLSVLGVWETQIPGFGIAALLEVHEDPKTHEYGLKVFLRNSTATAEPTPLEIPGCGYFCPLTKVADLCNDLLPSNLEAECKSKDPNYVPPPPSGP